MTFMQASVQSQTPTPAPTPPTPPATFTFIGADGKPQNLPIPRTEDEVRAIQAQREQISSQLENVSSRRSEIAQELSRTGAEAARGGLEARLRVLDQRILQLETDLASTGRQLSSAAPELVAGTVDEGTPNRGPDHFDDGFMAGGFSVFAFMSVVLLFLRRRWRRPGSKRPGQLESDSTQRLQRLEHGMEAIAIEIERVSEGQRFVTKLLSESHAQAAGAQRLAQPVAVESGDPAKR